MHRRREMKTEHSKLGTYIALMTGVLVMILLIWMWISYNTLIHREEHARSAWSQVESSLQRKLDLLPNLVKVVKRYASHESTLLREITALRTSAQAGLSSMPRELSAKRIEAIQETHKRIDGSVSRIFAIVENYPSLRASEQFMQLQAQIEGTENRIHVARMQFNTAVGAFNSYRRTLPASLIATLGGFTQKAYFKADQAAHKTIELDM
jgi:LemA protein